MASEPGNSSEPEYPEHEELDPRVQDELEKLNKASDDINSLELELDEARASFRQVLTESTQRLNALSKKLGGCIEKARPYYEARMRAKEAQIETQNAALRFERACSQQAAAKEMVYLAEQGFFTKGQPFDPAWQEMLNHATMKVNEAERERLESEVEHQRTAMIFSVREQRVKELQKQLKRNIAKSRPYFEMKARFNQHMEDQKKRVSMLEQQVVDAKRRYAEALHSLEMISDEIHEQRRESKLRLEMGSRGAGVGAETPEPPPTLESETSDSADSPTKSEMAEMGLSTRNGDRSAARLLRRSDSVGAPQVSGSITSRGSPVGGQDRRPLPRSTSADIAHIRRDSPKSLRLNSITSSLPSPSHNGCQTDPDLKDRRHQNGHGKDSPHGELQTATVSSGTPSSPQKDSQENDVSKSGDSNHLQVSEAAENGSESGDLLTPKSDLSSSQASATSPETDNEADTESQKTNAEIMATLQKAKSLRSPFLHPNRSREDLLDEVSDNESITGSLASLSVLDDEQIESLMMETGEYITFLAKQTEECTSSSPSKRTLPVKLAYLQDYVKFDHEWVDVAEVLRRQLSSSSSESKDLVMDSEPPAQDSQHEAQSEAKSQNEAGCQNEAAVKQVHATSSTGPLATTGNSEVTSTRHMTQRVPVVDHPLRDVTSSQVTAASQSNSSSSSCVAPKQSSVTSTHL